MSETHVTSGPGYALGRFWEWFFPTIWKSAIGPYRMLKRLRERRHKFSSWDVYDWAQVTILLGFGAGILRGVFEWQGSGTTDILQLTLLAYVILVVLNFVGYVLKELASSMYGLD